jgi:hypothetical protein
MAILVNGKEYSLGYNDNSEGILDDPNWKSEEFSVKENKRIPVKTDERERPKPC